ncbi:MAG TPA: DMT family transporter [bacterium]|nr:DMT family transporter [bacterium]
MSRPVLHQAVIDRRKGFTLAIFTSLMWAILPIALKSILKILDPVTTTWYRFSLAAFLQILIILRHRRFPTGIFKRNVRWLWFGAVSGLVANHTLFVLGLDFLQPVATTVFIQMAPMFLLAGGLIIFREPFSRNQWIGLLVLIGGMMVFFVPEIRSITQVDRRFFAGAGFIMLAALSWAIYAICQKQLLVHYSSQQVIVVVFLGGTLFLLPCSTPLNILNLDPVRIGLVIFAGFNTILAYGAFSEALNHWDASRVSAVLTTIPVQSVILMLAAQSFFPVYIEPELLTPGKFIGAVIVVTGSMICSLARRSHRSKEVGTYPAPYDHSMQDE